jgi:hypothetical protein
MTTPASRAEIALLREVERLGDRVCEDWFAVELYRAMAGRRWRSQNGDGAVALSWRRAEQVVDDLREAYHAPALSLTQRGGEGRLSEDVDRALRAHGWVSEPMNPDEHDPVHTDAAPEMPPRSGGPPTQWEQQAHQAAHQERVRKI